MTGRRILPVSAPIAPVIRIERFAAARRRHGGLTLIWRRPPKRSASAIPQYAGPASWAVTVNMLLKQAFTLQDQRPIRQQSPREERLRPARLPSPAKLVWRSTDLKVERRTELLRNTLRRLVLPEITAIDRWRTLMPLAAASVARRSPVRSSLPPVETWVDLRRRESPAALLLQRKSRRRSDPLPMLQPCRRGLPIVNASRAEAPRMAAPLIARSTRASARPTTIVTERRATAPRPEAADHPAPKVGRAKSSPAVGRFWRPGRAGGSLVPVYPEHARAAVQLVWAAPRVEAPAIMASEGIPRSVGSPSSRQVTHDLGPAALAAGTVQTGAPDVDRLVDEVFRRMDRQFRSERLRRGL
jgi:hypothetical protein